MDVVLPGKNPEYPDRLFDVKSKTRKTPEKREVPGKSRNLPGRNPDTLRATFFLEKSLSKSKIQIEHLLGVTDFLVIGEQ